MFGENWKNCKIWTQKILVRLLSISFLIIRPLGPEPINKFKLILLFFANLFANGDAKILLATFKFDGIDLFSSYLLTPKIPSSDLFTLVSTSSFKDLSSSNSF